jgi:hypothetical protein
MEQAESSSLIRSFNHHQDHSIVAVFLSSFWLVSDSLMILVRELVSWLVFL